MTCIRPLRGGFRYTANAWMLMPVQGVECGWKPGGWPKVRICDYIIAGGEISKHFVLKITLPPPTRFRYPIICYTPLCVKQTRKGLPI